MNMNTAGRLSRRDFLRLTGTGLAGATLLGAAGCGGGQGGNEVVFAMNQDPTPAIENLTERFNRQNEGGYRVRHRPFPADTVQYFDQLRTEFQAGGSDVDVIGGDVIWPAQFAANGWIVDLSDRFPESERKNFLDGPVRSNIYEGKVYGVPWFTDAGMLYYRKDLLDKNGFKEPPKTWDELKQMAKKVKRAEGTKFGFVFQGAQYEGGVVNGLEYINSYGGNVLDPEDASRVIIDSPESVAGLAMERSMVEEGVAPQGVTTYKEDESTAAFLNGDAVFLRNWPYVYAQLSDPEASKVRPEQVGVSALPAPDGGRSVSSLGGSNLYVSADTEPEVQDAAYEFIRFATTPEQQKLFALDGSYLPTRREPYDDEELREKIPVIALGEEALKNTQPRPVSPVYSDMSLEMAEQFGASLKGEASPEQAVSALQERLQRIAEQAEELS